MQIKRNQPEADCNCTQELAAADVKQLTLQIWDFPTAFLISLGNKWLLYLESSAIGHTIIRANFLWHAWEADHSLLYSKQLEIPLFQIKAFYCWRTPSLWCFSDSVLATGRRASFLWAAVIHSWLICEVIHWWYYCLGQPETRHLNTGPLLSGCLKCTPSIPYLKGECYVWHTGFSKKLHKKCVIIIAHVLYLGKIQARSWWPS